MHSTCVTFRCENIRLAHRPLTVAFFCLTSLQLGIVGDFFEEVVGVLLVVHVAADVLHAVADDEVVGMEQEIVGGNLIEHFLGEGYGGGFVFDEHVRTELLII